MADLKTDDEAELFVEAADLTEYDFAEMVPTPFEFQADAAWAGASLNARSGRPGR